jgi:hypothetical protein
MNLIELALTTYTEGTAAEAERDAEYAAEARAELLRFARACASSTLSTDAADLDWQCTTEGLPEEVEEARAVLAAGRPEYLRYRVDHQASPDVEVSFDLVQPCLACGHDRIAKVTSLFHLGQLLHQDPRLDAGPAPHTEPGPLAAVEALEARTAGVSQLARRLIAQHPDAGLAVSHIVCIGHDDGSGSTEIHFNAASTNAVRQVAAAIDAEVTTRNSSTPAPYGVVLEHASARGRLGLAVDVTVSGYTQLADDEAAAWRAQQDQATEPTADGGDA